MKKKNIFFACLFIVIGMVVKYINIIPLGNSCAFSTIEKIYSPDKQSYILIKSYLCGLLLNRYFILQLKSKNSFYSIDINENSFSSMDIKQTDILWPNKPLSTYLEPFPKVIWKDNKHVDIYVVTNIKFGLETINAGSYKNGITIIIHYNNIFL